MMSEKQPISPSLSAWFETEQGQYVLAREQAYFDRTVSRIFGFNALQLGLPTQDFLSASRMPLRLKGAFETGAAVCLCCDELPFACASIDLVLMPHILEFAKQPHQVLREVERVLIPEGNLIISGFNPYSLWGLQRKWGNQQGYPWCGEFIALTRLKDWLALLGFEVVGGRFAAYAPPFSQSHWLEERFAFMEAAGDRWWAVSGGVYFLHAVKRVHGMHLIKPKWDKGLIGQLLPTATQPTSRQSESQ
ncbi:MAG: class I SAM-dependent methyltransferase [Gallionella sp.]|nr:class I SAM-dependent methyltransferase [Gallionella sp.]